jgi:hypothetical protein
MHTGIHQGNSGKQEKVADIIQFPRAFYQKLRTANVMEEHPTAGRHLCLDEPLPGTSPCGSGSKIAW